MPIRIKHAPSAAAIGESAYTIGRGEKMRWATDIALKRQALGLQAASIGAQAKARASALEQRKEEFDVRTEQDAASRAAAEGRWEDEFGLRKEQLGLQLQKQLDAKDRLDRENTIIDYTPEQLNEKKRLNACRTRLLKEYREGKWTLAGLEEGMLQLKRAEDLIIPQTMLRTEMTPTQDLKSRIRFDATGKRYLKKANGDWVAEGMSEEDYLKMVIAAAVAFKTQDMRTTIKDKSGKEIDNKDFGKETIDYEKARAFIDDERARFAQTQGYAVIAEEEQKRQAEQGPPQIPIDENVKMQNVINSRQKAIDHVKSVLQQEDYASMGDKEKRDIGVNMLKRYGIKVTPDELKTKPARKVAPAERKVAPEVDMTKLDEMALNRIQKFKSMKIKWSWVSETYGQEEAEILKYICESGNEQAIANALKQMGII